MSREVWRHYDKFVANSTLNWRDLTADSIAKSTNVVVLDLLEMAVALHSFLPELFLAQCDFEHSLLHVLLIHFWREANLLDKPLKFLVCRYRDILALGFLN